MSITQGVKDGGQDQKGTTTNEVYVDRHKSNSKAAGQKKQVQFKIRNLMPKYYLVELHGCTPWRSLLRH